ncbi:hypothetical protein L6164_026964 [Bauhinia variegata]|uniref:Uncharacterized protein n=1 Tax=Bauhinia variegata TaxID=167791 RepID=A0ACB9LRS9_BAUVA|nr:hypothetical protein L6164_026964 [Bauhinia variegata]
MANLKMLLITALGAALALERYNILGEEATKHMNMVTFFVFNPALIASNLAKTITYKSVAMLWFMPFNILISFVIGSILGWILLKIVKVPHILRGLVLACCSAGNVGTIFLVVIPAICTDKNSPFGDADICNAQALAYISLSLAIGSLYLWLYVYNMVRIAAMQISNPDNSVSISNISSGQQSPSDEHMDQLEAAHQILEPRNTSKISNSENSTSISNISCGQKSPSDNCMDQLESAHQTAEPKNTVAKQQVTTLKEKIIFHIKDIAIKYLNLKGVLTPSTTAVVVGLIIGVVQPFRKVLIGENAPLHVLQDSASLLGAAAVPAITLVMGANLLKGLRKSDLKVLVISLIMVVRYIFLPILGVAIVRAAVHFKLIPPDPLYQFILLLQYTAPPAINIVTITQLFGLGEKECSVIFLATYGAAPVALTLWSTFFLQLVQR